MFSLSGGFSKPLFSLCCNGLSQSVLAVNIKRHLQFKLAINVYGPGAMYGLAMSLAERLGS